MAKIKIKHFGPIREGITGGDGWLHFDKVTVLIGNQATGKSSVAKLLSTISWIEKAIYRRVLTAEELTSSDRFQSKYCAYQRLYSYFGQRTEIEYEGAYLSLRFKNGRTYIAEKGGIDYFPPKLMYVPGERNILSVLPSTTDLPNLPLPLFTFLDEFDLAKKDLDGSLRLPISDAFFEHQAETDLSYIVGKDYRVRLHNASSGLQSVLPLYLVSRFLAKGILGDDGGNSVKQISLEQKRFVQHEIQRILEQNNLTDGVKNELFQRLNAIYRNKALVNIVEEPEQNLYPKSQMSLLFELLNFNNWTEGNKLLLTTHSPYILNYLSLAIKAKAVLDKVPHNDELELKKVTTYVDEIVPANSIVDQSEVHIYELDESGTITQLETYNGIPTDDNHLNQFLAETNDLFDRLLEIEDSLDD